MPIYEYKCQQCGKHHEVMQKITEKPLKKCPDCGGEMKKMISSTSFVLKGSGWYATDYASDKKKSEGKTSGDKKKVDSKFRDTGSEAAKTETKPEAQSGGKPDGKPNAGGSTDSSS